MSNHFKVVLFVRFLGYFFFLTGLAVSVFTFGPLVEAELGYRKDQILGVRRTVPNIVTSAAEGQPPTAGFGDIAASGEIITPAATDFGIVIEKINANAQVIANVNPADEKEYLDALTKGVAHAAGTNLPGEKGNIYLFSHSTDSPLNFSRYNAIFYLLNKLEAGDRVIIFYQNKRNDYIVFDKAIVPPSDVSYLTNRYDEEVLTLQTCDPPGTTINRLVVRAKKAA